MSNSEDVKEAVDTNTTILVLRKNTGIALILSIIIIGVGQMYVGKVGRGIKILLSCIALFIIPPILLVVIAISAEIEKELGSSLPESVWLLVIGSFLLYIPAVILYVWQIIDAYRQASRYNDALLKLKRKPENTEY